MSVQRFMVSKKVSNLSENIPNLPYAIGGGSIIQSGGYRIHTFAIPETTSINFTNGGLIEYLIIAGGGGGSYWVAGGGGAGGLLYGNNVVSQLSYSIVVGIKGLGAVPGTPGPNTPYTNASTPSSYGQKGGNSSFLGLTAFGGGTGAGYNSDPLSLYIDGGSGAGGRGSVTNKNGGQGVSGQGNSGGTGGAGYASGGGGGAGGAGNNAVSNDQGGAGGNGLQFSISGTATFYAGGGGGGNTNTNSSGGSGIGGQGTATVQGGNATASTGSGGGSNSNTQAAGGGNGSDGIVIIRYLYS